MSRNKDGSEVLVWVSMFLLFGAGLGLYVKVKALGAMMGLDVETAFSVLMRGTLLLVIVGTSLRMGFFRLLLPYLPFAVFLAISPALTRVAWNYSDVIPDYAMNSEPAWYGVNWIQGVIALSLLAAGTAYHWKQGE